MGNVLFITADQWRGDALSAVGHKTVRTPALDALARQGTLFRQHYANAYPCGPSRACLHTGLYAHTHRSVRNGTPLDARHGSLAMEARRAGYEPLLFGYTDTSLDPRGRAPADPARHTYESVLPGYTPMLRLGDDAAPWLGDLIAKGYDLPDPAAGREQMFGGGIGDPARFREEDGETRFVVDRVIRHLTVAGRKPWFVHLSLICPHPPYVAPAPWHALYDPASGPPAVRGTSAAEEAATHPLLAALHGLVPMRRFLPDAPGLAAALSDAALAHLRAVYWGMVSMVDAELGRLFAWLAEAGLDRDTLIVFTSDHGELLGDHYLLGKCAWFDGSAHVPLIVRDPRRAQSGHTVEAFTESVDIMPTILDWLGCPVPVRCDGASLLPFCAGGQPASVRDAVHWEHDFGDLREPEKAAAVGIGERDCALVVHRERHRKYVHFTALPPLYYDLAQDPGELVDRAGDPASARDVMACAQKLLSWRMHHEDRALTDVTLRDGYLEGVAV